MNHVLMLFRAGLIVCVVAVLASCGGGGATATSTPGTATPVTLQASPILAASVPVSTSSQIASISSATTSAAATDTTISVPPSTVTGDSPVTATSSSGDVLLMQFVKLGNTPSLSANSTALAFARLALGPIATSPAVTVEVEAAIEGAPEFQNLQSVVLQALQSGTPPVQSAAVITSISRLIPQAQSTLGAAITSSVSHSTSALKRARTLAATPPPLPYDLIPGNLVTKVTLSDAPQLPGINLSNYGEVALTASVTEIDGTSQGTAITLSSHSLLSLVQPTYIPANTDPFVVGVAFDTAAQTLTFATLIANEASALLNSILPPPINISPKCLGGIFGAALNPGIAQLAVAPSISSIAAYYLSFFSTYNARYNTINAAASCSGITLSAAAEAFLVPLGKTIAVLQLAATSADTYLGVQQYFNYLKSNPRPTVEICKSGGVVISCALQVQTSSPYIAIGQSEQASALNALGTPISTGIIWQLAASSQSASIDATTGLIKANFPGGFVVEATDLYLDVGMRTLTTYVPAISPTSGATVAVGKSIGLTLVDPSGGLAVLSPAWTWSTSTPAIATVEAVTGTVSGLSAGVAQVTVSDPITGTALSTSVDVTSSEFWEGSYQITGCNDPNTVGTGGAAAACAYALSSPLPGGGQLAVAFGASEVKNIRRDFVFNIEICDGYTAPLDLAASSAFTLPIDVTGLLLPANIFPGPITTAMVFNVVSRSPAQISGTFDADFQDVVNQSPWTAGAGHVSGTWALHPRKTSFPKCTYPAPMAGCISNNYSWQNGGEVNPGSCDFQSFAAPGRPGEWLGLR